MTINTEMAIAKCVDILARLEHRTEKEMIKVLLVEALAARGMMHPMEKTDAPKNA